MATFILSIQSQDSQPAQITIKTEKKKVFDISACHIDTFNTSEFNMADCLERCLRNCRCQSFQICKKTAFEWACQLCSSHKDNNLSLHDDKDCVYATYEMRNSTGNVEVLSRDFFPHICGSCVKTYSYSGHLTNLHRQKFLLQQLLSRVAIILVCTNNIDQFNIALQMFKTQI